MAPRIVEWRSFRRSYRAGRARRSADDAWTARWPTYVFLRFDRYVDRDDAAYVDGSDSGDGWYARADREGIRCDYGSFEVYFDDDFVDFYRR